MRQITKHLFVDETKAIFEIRGPKGVLTSDDLLHGHSPDDPDNDWPIMVGLDNNTFKRTVEAGFDYLDEIDPEN